MQSWILFLNHVSCLRHSSQAKPDGGRPSLHSQVWGQALRRDEAAQHHRPSVPHTQVLWQRHARWAQEGDLQVAERQQDRYDFCLDVGYVTHKQAVTLCFLCMTTGEGQYGKVYTCINVDTGELMAMKEVCTPEVSVTVCSYQNS